MIISHIIGGLGNQMFQYALGKALALRSRKNLKLDIRGFENYALREYALDAFQIDNQVASKEDITTIKRNGLIYNERHFHFDPNIFTLNKSAYLKGYWQSEKYFIEYRDILLKEFEPQKKPSFQTNQYRELIQTFNSVSLHIRRGDYVSNPTTNSFHGTCGLDYYQNAVSLIENRIVNPHFFIFSDDIDWAKKNLGFIKNITFIELSKDIPDYEEMLLMSQCKHNIIANSSFSWWGAWLNQNPYKIVIAPEIWFLDQSLNTKDLIPETWIRLSSNLSKQNDLVSIIMPCYNQAKYLEEAIKSVIYQSYTNIEIIIVNDGSQDNTKEVALLLQEKYPGCIDIINQKNRGLSEARNSGIHNALGQYILPLDSDDKLEKNMITLCMNAMIKNNADIVHGALQCFGDRHKIWRSKPFSENNILYANLPHQSSLYRKKVWIKTQGYKSNMKEGYEDWEFWINAYKHHFKFHYLPDILYYYRVKNVSRETSAQKKDIYLKSKIIMNHPELYTLNQVQEAIETIKKTEELADVYFYHEKNISYDEKKLITGISHYIKNNTLTEKQTINIFNTNVGLCTLDLYENNDSLQELHKTMHVEHILFYAPLRYDIASLISSHFALNNDADVLQANGTLFPFVSKSQRINHELQIIAQQRLLQYQAKIKTQKEIQKNKHKLVSIIIPCYNQELYLQETVESVVTQNYPNIEIIIVNDGSTDASKAVAQKLSFEYKTKNIRIINQVNKGLSEARNSGIKAAGGDFLVLLDADDKLHKGMIRKCMQAIQEYDADIIYGNFQRFGERTTMQRTINKVDLYYLQYANVTGCTALYKKYVWEKTGGYKVNMAGGYEDWEMWVNAAKNSFKFQHIPEVLFHYRIKKESMHVEARKKHTYLFSKIVLNHPELYTSKQQDEAILCIKEFEDAPDFYFYLDKNRFSEEKELILSLGKYIKDNKLYDRIKVGETCVIPSLNGYGNIVLCSLSAWKYNDDTTNINQVIFYSMLHHNTLDMKINKIEASMFGWSHNKGCMTAKGTFFPIFTDNNPTLQIEAYKRSERYMEEKYRKLEQTYENSNHIENNQINTIRDSAVSLEKINLELAYKLMQIAHEARPSGKFIQQKLKEYADKINSQ